MKLSTEGRKLIENFEGRRNRAYQDSAGLWTIGIGHLIGPSEPELRTAVLTEQQINDIFAEDVAWAEEAVAAIFPGITRHNQFDALVSFMFNLGPTAVRNGTLDDLINNGASAEAISAKWMQYIRAGGRTVPGLIVRRTAEVKHYWQHLWRIAVLWLVIAAAFMASAGITLLA